MAGTGAAAGGAPSASLDVSGPATAPAGENVTITYAVTNSNGSTADYSLITQTPDDWTVADNASDDGTWSSDTNVTFSNVADGDTVEATITYEATSPTESVYLFNASVANVDTKTIAANATHPVVVPENVAWEGAPLPLRADTDSAATVVDNQGVYIRNADGQERSVNRDELAVYDAGTTIPINLNSVNPGANLDQFDGEEVRFLVGHIAEQPDTSAASNVSSSTIPRSITDAQSLLTAENISEINANVNFSRPVSSSTLDSSNGLSFDLDASDPGQYGIIAVSGERLFKVNDGNVTAAGPSNGTVIGVEGVAVQSGASDIDAPDNVEPGDTVQLGVDTDLSGNVSHAVAIYHEDTWTNSRTNLNLTEPLSTDMTTDDVIVEHEITGLNGVVWGAANVDLLGMSFSERRASGTVLVDDIVSTAANEAGVDKPKTVPIGSTTLDGSTVAVADVQPDGTVVVPTFGNWTEGEYRYVHVASENDSTRAFETNTGTLSIETPADGGDDGDGGGGYYPPPSDGGDEGGLTFEDIQISSTEIQSGGDLEVSMTVRNTGDSGISRSLTLYAGDTALDTQTVTMGGGASLDVTFQGTIEEPGTYDLVLNGTTVGTVEVTGSQDPGEPSIAVSSTDLSASTITVGESVTATATVENTGDTEGESTIEFSVDGEVVDEQTVTVAAGGSTTVEFTRTFDQAGTYELAIGDASLGDLTVEEAPSSGGDDGSPILLIVVVLGVLVSAVLGYLYYIGELATIVADIRSRFE
ncbi:CARDB domain-containing protein [Salinarchaeum laminariae]|uniref:CARDB domain-containing protein n=1 Tax=Salinarchaeum laminariae TaxID=869888 RepID=UPI0020BEE00B|nr:CARDB domain-containing protein [Salinarchaeum laminariae]